MKIREAKDCRFDLVSLGECMVRLSPPGHGRIEFATTLEVWVGGGEYNVAYALARLGLRTGFLSRLVGQSRRAHHPQSRPRRRRGYEPRASWPNIDGVGRADRIGLEFHRSRHRRARQRHHVRPRPLRRQQHEAGHDRFQERLRRTGRPLAAHRRNLRRPLRRTARPSAKEALTGRQARRAPSSATI